MTQRGIMKLISKWFRKYVLGKRNHKIYIHIMPPGLFIHYSANILFKNSDGLIITCNSIKSFIWNEWHIGRMIKWN